jgi:hypothetical protein
MEKGTLRLLQQTCGICRVAQLILSRLALQSELLKRTRISKLTTVLLLQKLRVYLPYYFYPSLPLVVRAKQLDIKFAKKELKAIKSNISEKYLQSHL